MQLIQFHIQVSKITLNHRKSMIRLINKIKLKKMKNHKIFNLKLIPTKIRKINFPLNLKKIKEPPEE